MIPDSLWIDNGDWAVLADSEAICFRTEGHGIALCETQFDEAALEKSPGFEPLFLVAAFGFSLVSTEKNVALDARDAKRVCNLGQSFHRRGILHGYNQDMKRTIATFALGAVLMLGADKPIDVAKGLIKAKKFEEAVAVLEPATKAAPKDTVVKSALVEALMGNGDAYMYNEKLPPFKKYPAALKSYRRVLEFDKTNQKAKDNVSMIEGIYKSMGRPVPQ